MAENGDTRKLDPVLQPFADFWAGYAKHANETARGFLEGAQENADVKSWQRKWSNAVSQSMDAFMRSPMFLQGIKQHTDSMIKFKRQLDDVAAELARNANIPTTADISGLFERIHSVEEVILQRLNHIEQRLDQIEQQVGSEHHATS